MSENRQGSRFSKTLFLWIFVAIAVLSFVINEQSEEVSDGDEASLSQTKTAQKFSIEFDSKSIDERIDKLTDRTSRIKDASSKLSGDVNQSISKSMKWLNQSMDSLQEKLNDISDKWENTRDEKVVEAEIKKAFREAFVVDSRAVETAEVTGEPKEFEGLATEDAPIASGIDLPVLGDGTPAWIRQRLISDNRVQVPIESSMHGTLEECREELAAKLPGEVKKIIDEYVLKNVSANSIPNLTPQYIKDMLIDDAVEFDNYQERPSGNFHQLWVRLDIDKDEIHQIRDWEREATTTSRVWVLSGLSLAFLGSFAGLSEVFKFLSSRERNRNRSRQTA